MFDLIRVSLFGASNTGGVPFDPAKDISSLAGKIILVTGGAGGIGREAVLEFLRHKPTRLYILDLPQPDDGEAMLAGIREAVPDAPVRFIPVNLASFESIAKGAAQFNEAEDRLDICLCNAGVMPVKPTTTPEGFETTFGINYLGHALLVRLLEKKLLQAAALPDADVRLVFVCSEGHVMVPKGGIAFDELKTSCAKLQYFYRYGQSKLAINLFMRELSSKHPQIRVVAVHPGRISTGIATELLKYSAIVRVTQPLTKYMTVPPALGARNSLWACTSPATKSGKYYEPVGVPDHESKLSRDPELCRKLREWTDEALKDYASA
ncbi:Retinol dehydrogenase 13 [Mycena chlorophos]|uniref:Retinol dehydrogenase 13 n=1 Tax=Mycena chlorophos TaxID=658473 RepID=A0A8H6S2M9_MYCCL|nr:Retinol dehydrogenase 13 [Mycena chlorophos]